MAVNIRFTADEIEVIKSLKAMGGATAHLVEENIRLAKAFSKTDAEAKFFARGIERARKENSVFKKEISDTASTLIGLQSGLFGGLGGSLGAASKIGGLAGAGIGAGIDGAIALGVEVSKTTEKYNRLQMALDTATGSAQKGAEAFSFLVNIARQTGLRIDDLAESYKGFAAASKGTKLEGKETERIFTSIVKAGAAMMLSNEQVKGSLLAVSQMMSKGNVQAEELRGQLSERLPGAFNILAQEMGVTTAQLNDMLKAGAVLSEVALPLLANGLDKISKDQYSKNLDTITGAMNSLKNEVDLVVVAFGRESDINGFFANIINGAASVVRSGWLQKLGDAVLAATPGIGLYYTGFKANKAIEKTNDPYRKISKSEGIVDASTLSLTEQKRRLDAEYKRMKFLDKAASPKSNIATNSEQLENYQREHKAILANYTLRKQAYEGEISQRATAKKIAEDKLGLDKKELTQLKDINKEIDKSRSLLNDLKKKDPTGFTRTKEGAALMEKIGKLNKEKADITELGKIGKQQKIGSGESTLAKKIKKENEEAKDLFAVRLAIIKQAGIDAQRLIQFSETSSKVYGKGLADIQTGFGNELLADGIQKDKWGKMLPDVEYMSQILAARLTSFQSKINEETGKLEYSVVFDPSKIKGLSSSYNTSAQEVAEEISATNQMLAGIIGDSVSSVLSVLDSAIADSLSPEGLKPLKEYFSEFINSLGDMMVKLGTQMIAQGAILAALGVPTGGATAIPASQQLIAGGALFATGQIYKAIKFADGGIVSGRTFAEVGEYRGAKNNPEVIAPLNKLGAIFTPYFQKAVDMGRVNQPQLAMQPISTQTNVYMDGKVFLQQIDRTLLKQSRGY